MDAYRNDHDAALYLNDSLELDVRDLVRENGELREKLQELEDKNTRLGIIASELMHASGQGEGGIQAPLTAALTLRAAEQRMENERLKEDLKRLRTLRTGERANSYLAVLGTLAMVVGFLYVATLLCLSLVQKLL
jgi:hypothetical protein